MSATSPSTAPSGMALGRKGQRAIKSQHQATPDTQGRHESVSSGRTLIPESSTGSSSHMENTSALPAVDTAFTSAEKILSQARATGGDSLVVAPASPEDYAEVKILRDARGEKLRLFYQAELRLLIVTVPTSRHENLHLRLYKQIYNALSDPELQDDWDASGATTFSAANGSSTGEGDSGGRPWSMREDDDSWPTLVIEAGWTQSLASLRIKKDFWFHSSSHQVKIVLLAKAFPATAATTPRILIEHWQEQSAPARRGATETRAHAAAPRESICLQTINIVWSGPVPYHAADRATRMDKGNFNVTRGPLCLDFVSMFLRPPAVGAQQSIVVADHALQMYASRAWLREQ